MPRRGKRKQKRNDDNLTDDQLLDMAIARAKQEKESMSTRKAEKPSPPPKEDRAQHLIAAEDANVPHASFMELPEHPDDISKSQHSDSFHRILQKPAGGADAKQGTARERAAYARRVRKWKRNGCRGTPPSKPEAVSGGKATAEEYFSNPVLVDGHKMQYARWVLRNLKTLSPGEAHGVYTFNVIGDPMLRSDTLVIALVKRDACVYAYSFEAGADVPEEVDISPDYLLEVLPGGTPPRQSVGKVAAQFVNRTEEFYRKGIPSGLVTEGRKFDAGYLTL